MPKPDAKTMPLAMLALLAGAMALAAQTPPPTCVPGQGMNCTTNLNLFLPPQNYPNWNVQMNNNFIKIDSQSSKWGIPTGVGSGEVLINSNGVIGSIPGFVYNSGTNSLSSPALSLQVQNINATTAATAPNFSATTSMLAPYFNATTGYQINGSYGTAGQVLQSTGSGTIWATPSSGGGTPPAPGTSGSVLFNNNGTIDGANGFTWTPAANTVSVAGLVNSQYLLAGAYPNSVPQQGSYLTWGGPGFEGFGGTLSINAEGAGTGGFEWYNYDNAGNSSSSPPYPGTLLAGLDNTGSYFVNHDLYTGEANGHNSGSGTVHAASLTGNAATATQLATAPAACASNGSQYSTGIGQNGNALCSNFATSTIGSGYQKLLGGIIIEWGFAAGNGAQAVTFPLKFPTAVLSVTAMADNTGSFPGRDSCVVTAWNPGPTFANGSTGFTMGTSSNSSTTSCHWIAVGW